ncbi:MAG: CsbD family protein [Verrucomicrobia bacterium]|nr:CsbD family protein [Verrucomicrobiota bacterium]
MGGHEITKLEIKGDWNITKGKLKQKWAKLTDDDLQYVEGKSDELLGRIQKRIGESREAVEKAVKEACASCGCK